MGFIHPEHMPPLENLSDIWVRKDFPGIISLDPIG